MTPEEQAEADALKAAKKKDGEEKSVLLREIQNRIIAVEADIKAYKGAEADNIRAIAKETIKALEDEIAALKLSMKAPAQKEKGLFDWFWED